MVRQIMFQIILVNSYQMTLYLCIVKYLIQTTYRSHPHAQNIVGQTTGTILVFRSLLLEKFHGFLRITAAKGHYLHRIGSLKALPLDFLYEVLSIKKRSLHILLALSQYSCILLNRFLQCFSHLNKCSQSTQIETGTHSVWSPKLNIISIVMRFFKIALTQRVPGTDTIVKTLLHQGEELFHPLGIPAYTPFTIYLHYTS